MTSPTAVLSMAWVALIVSAAMAGRPRSTRTLGPVPLRRRGPPGSAVGAAARRLLGRSTDPDLDLRAGQVLVGFAGGAVVDLRLGVALGTAALVAPVLRERKRRRRHDAAIVRELPEVIDLLRLALSGRGSILNAVASVGELPLGPVSTEFASVRAEVDRGHRVGEVLERVGEHLGSHVQPLVRALVGADTSGTELGPTLERLAREARDTRRRRAQTEARRVPIRMLMPLVLGILPAFVLLTVVPTLARTFDGLDL